MSTQAMGPTLAGGSQPIVKGGYSVTVLPDINNRELQAVGEAPVFYWIPNQVQMARKDGPAAGDYLFNLVRFAGTGGDGVIGGGGDVAGGVLTFTVTGALPPDVQKQVEDAVVGQYTGSQDAMWGIRSGKRPIFRPAIITSSTTTVSNVAPTARGLPTVVAGADGHAPRATSFFGMPGARTDARPLPQLAPRDGESGSAVALATRDSNLDPWYWEMHGNGSGSIDPTGAHAFSGILGAYPTAICWEAFHGTASPLIVIQNYKLKVWSPVVTLTIKGHWDRISDSFKAAASGRYLWASVDVKATINKMRIDGTLEVDLKVDQTLPGAAEIAKRLDERSDLVFTKFMELAKGIIFDPPVKEAEDAHASSSGGGFFSPWGAGVALNYRRDETHLDLKFEQTEQYAYLQDHTISSSLAGMYDEMKKDPLAAKKYFLSVSLDDWPRRLARICRPVVPWADNVVEFVDVNIGYPNSRGELNWEGHSFSGTEGEDGSWKYQTAQKAAEDVTNPPAGWTSGLTAVKRRVHLKEPPSALTDPYTRVQIEKNVIDIDAGPDGVLLNDTTLEIRADSAGRLAVGPIELGVMLTDASQLVEVVFEPVDPDSGDPIGMEQVRFRWSEADLAHDRKWFVFTGDPQFRPFYRYKVAVTVKGTLFEPGRAWEGPWTPASGNGPLVVGVPRPDGPGVTTRSAPPDAIQVARAAARAARDAEASAGKGTPAEPALPAAEAGAPVDGMPPRPRESVPVASDVPDTADGPVPVHAGHGTYLSYQL